MERRQATQDQARLPTAASFFRREGQDGALGNQCVTQVIGARAGSALRTQAWSSQSFGSPPPPPTSSPPWIRKDLKGSSVSEEPKGAAPLSFCPKQALLLCHFPVNTPQLEATGVLIFITRDEFAVAELHISGTMKYIYIRF